MDPLLIVYGEPRHYVYYGLGLISTNGYLPGHGSALQQWSRGWGSGDAAFLTSSPVSSYQVRLGYRSISM